MSRTDGTFAITSSESIILDVSTDGNCRQASFYNTGAKDVLIRADGVHAAGAYIPLAGSESNTLTGQPRGVTLGHGRYPIGTVRAKCSGSDTSTIKGGPVA